MILFPIPDSWLKRLLFVMLYQLPLGELTLITPERETWHFVGKAHGPIADVTLNDWWVVKRLLFEGEARFIEDHKNGQWETEDMPVLMELIKLNAGALRHRFQHHPLVRVYKRLRAS